MITLLDVMAEVHAKLIADANLVTLASGGIWDVPPQQSSMPFVSFGPPSGLDNGNKKAVVSTFMLQVDAWSEYEGNQEIAQMVALIYTVLHERTLTSGHLCRCDSVNVLPGGDGAVRHAVVMVRIIG